MANRAIRPGVAATLAGGLIACAVLMPARSAHADTVADLVNVTVRPGYNFADVGDALTYGHAMCDQLLLATATPQ